MKTVDHREKWEGSPESVGYSPGKGFIAALVGGAIAAFILAAAFFWYIPTVGLKNIHPALPYITGVLVFGAGAFFVIGVSVIAISLMKGKDILPSPRYRWVLVRFFLPLMALIGGILKIPKIKIEQAFIDLNNRMVKALIKGGKRFSPEKIVVLMPHCIQHEECRIKVTKDVSNCVGCGRCEIGELVGLSEEYNINLFVLTGGTVARRRLEEFAPDAVIAVACERDLTSGVQDAYPLPVLAIVNKRPFGYCERTGVAVEDIKAAVEDLMGRAAMQKTSVAG